MPSAADIPYQLRPNKFIDRQIFLDLMSRVVALKADGRYIYVSMGGKHLVDQESAYRKIGLRNLYSFDGDGAVVDRQKCNRPNDSAICVEMFSGALAGELDTVLNTFKGAENLIIWLDYTSPNKRLTQLQEFTEILRRCQPGDVVRITLNADDRTLRGPWEKDGFDAPGAYRASRLREQIENYFPASIETIPENGLPKALSRAVELAASTAGGETALQYLPVLLTSYADRQRMFTATVLVLASGDILPSGLAGWEFEPTGWEDVIEISAPDLSIREKVMIDQHLTKEPGEIIRAIGFQPASELDDAYHALASYKRLHRFYPTFYAIGIQ